jgi:hypothetical protein
MQKNFHRRYISPLDSGGGAAAPIPTPGAEQLVSPALMP